VHPARAVLEGELDVIEPGFAQRLQARLRETHAGGDEVAVEPKPVRGGDDRLEIVTDERLAARKPELHRSQRARLLENPQPLPGLELAPDVAEVGRVVAEDAVQRATVGELEKQPEQRPGCRGVRRGRLAHEASSPQLCSTASWMNAHKSYASPVAE